MKMKPAHHTMPEPLLQRLRDQATREGLPVSEVIRNAVRAYLEKNEQQRATA